MKDKTKTGGQPFARPRRGDDGLGANSEIGAKLRAYFGSVQDQPIPEQMLDLLEKLDSVERKGKNDTGRS